MELFAYIAIAICAVFVVPRGVMYPYRTGRYGFTILAGYFGLGLFLLRGATVYVSQQTALVVALMLAWWGVCAALSRDRRIPWRMTLRSASVVFLGLFFCGGPHQTLGMVILMCAALLNALAAYMEGEFNYKFPDAGSAPRPPVATAMIGNSNMLGAYLAPYVFVALWLYHAHHPAWVMAVPVILYAVYLTRCRGAWIGLAAGCGVYSIWCSPWVPAVAAGVGIAWFLRRWFQLGAKRHVAKALMEMMFEGYTLGERLHYWWLALYAMPSRPVFGFGMGGMFPEVPSFQRALNQKTRGRFLDSRFYKAPWPRAVHQDILQHILDFGIPGVIFMGWLFFHAFAAGVVDLDPRSGALMAGLAVVLGHGLFMHTFHILPALGTTSVLLAALLSSSPASAWTFAPVQSAPIWAGYAVLGYMVYQYGVLRSMYDVACYRYRSNPAAPGARKWLDRALAVDPESSMVCGWAASYYQRKGESAKALMYIARACCRYDGVIRVWDLWTNFGSLSVYCGALPLAEGCYVRALSYLPGYAPAEKGLAFVRSILAQANRAKPAETEDKGGLSQCRKQQLKANESPGSARDTKECKRSPGRGRPPQPEPPPQGARSPA